MMKIDYVDGTSKNIEIAQQSKVKVMIKKDSEFVIVDSIEGKVLIQKSFIKSIREVK